jgi:hypothetical protein
MNSPTANISDIWHEQYSIQNFPKYKKFVSVEFSEDISITQRMMLNPLIKNNLLFILINSEIMTELWIQS